MNPGLLCAALLALLATQVGGREMERMGISFAIVDVEFHRAASKWHVHCTGASALECLSIVAGRAGVALAISKGARKELSSIESLEGAFAEESLPAALSKLVTMCNAQQPADVKFMSFWTEGTQSEPGTKIFHVIKVGERNAGQ